MMLPLPYMYGHLMTARGGCLAAQTTGVSVDTKCVTNPNECTADATVASTQLKLDAAVRARMHGAMHASTRTAAQRVSGQCVLECCCLV